MGLISCTIGHRITRLGMDIHRGHLSDRGFPVVPTHQVIELEQQLGQKGEWGFKALKQTMKLHFRQGQYKEMMEKVCDRVVRIRKARLLEDSVESDAVVSPVVGSCGGD